MNDEENAIISIDELIPKVNNRMAVYGFTLSICSLFLNLYGIVGIFSLIFSSIGLIQLHHSDEHGKKRAIAGLLIAIISTFYGLYSIIKVIVF